MPIDRASSRTVRATEHVREIAMDLLPLVRRIVARHPFVRWLAIGLLASSVGLITGQRIQAIDDERRSWGETMTVWVTRAPLAPGTEIGADVVDAHEFPRALVPDEPISEPGGTLRRQVGAGEVLVRSDVAATSGPGALVPDGWSALAVPAIGLPVSAGDQVSVAASGTILGGGVVVVGPDAAGVAVVAVPTQEVAAVAAAVLIGDAVLALSPSPPAP